MNHQISIKLPNNQFKIKTASINHKTIQFIKRVNIIVTNAEAFSFYIYMMLALAPS